MRTLTPRQVSCPTEVSPLHVTRPLRPFCIQSPYAPPSPLSHATPQLDGSPLRVQTSPVACRLVGVTRPNRFRLLRTGLSPPVALHLALGDAVTFGYRPESVCLKRTFTSLNVCAHGRTSLGFQPQDRDPIQSSAPKGRRHKRGEPRCGWMECLRPFRAPGNWGDSNLALKRQALCPGTFGASHSASDHERSGRRLKSHALQCCSERRPGSACQPVCTSRVESCRRNIAWVTATIREWRAASSSSQAAASLTRAASAADGYCRRRVKSRFRPPTESAHAASGRRSPPRVGLSRSSSRNRGETKISCPGASRRADATARAASLESTRSARPTNCARWAGTRSSSWIPAAS